MGVFGNEYIHESYLGKVFMGFKIKPHQSLEESFKKGKYEGLMNYINNSKSVDNITYLRNDARTGINQVKKVAERIDKVQKEGLTKETQKYHTVIYNNFIKNGITSKDALKYADWLNNTFIPACNARIKELKESK